MNRLCKTSALAALLLLCAAPALMAAQAEKPTEEEIAKAAEGLATKATAKVEEAQQILGREGFNIFFGAAFGAGLVILGAAYGISKIGSAAVESMARQPEVAGSVQTAMIISAALIEGVTFFALAVCIAKL